MGARGYWREPRYSILGVLGFILAVNILSELFWWVF